MAKIPTFSDSWPGSHRRPAAEEPQCPGTRFLQSAQWGQDPNTSVSKPNRNYQNRGQTTNNLLQSRSPKFNESAALSLRRLFPLAYVRFGLCLNLIICIEYSRLRGKQTRETQPPMIRVITSFIL